MRIVRPLSVFGYDDRDHGGHAEIAFDDVRVPASNLIGEEGSGFAIAQARLGPGRIHHCMRALGMGERALSLVRSRANERHAFGRTLAEQGVIREWAAESRIQLEALRLLVLKTAWLMDTVGNRQAMTEIQAIKIAVPRAVQTIIDRAIQVLRRRRRVVGHAARRAVRRHPVAPHRRRTRRGAPLEPRPRRAAPLSVQRLAAVADSGRFDRHQDDLGARSS